MPEPRLVIAGHCTQKSAKILAVFDSHLPGGRAHLHCSINGERSNVSVPAVDANPYSLALFELEGLSASDDGSILNYSIDSEEKSSDHPFRKRLKLLPAGRPLRIALVSCNGVYRIKDMSRRFLLWRELYEQIQNGKVDLIIHAGDQIYADSIAMQRISKPNWSRSEELRKLVAAYRKIYVDSWSVPEIESVLSSCPSLMMWDDHDIFDGYGSHGDDSSELAQTIFTAAKQAFWEFQAQKNPSRFGGHSFAFGVQIDKTGILILDGRSNRMWNSGSILGDSQLSDIEAWLHFLVQQKPSVLLIVTAIPFLHVPVMSYLRLLEFTGGPGGLVEDLRDSWTARNNLQEGRRILRAIFQFKNDSPGTNVILLSGDVHVATAGTIESSTLSKKVYQIVSSGIGSPPPYGIVRTVLRWASSERVSLMDGEFHGELKRLRSPDQNFLLAKRNFAILDLSQGVQSEFFSDYGGTIVRFVQKLD